MDVAGKRYKRNFLQLIEREEEFEYYFQTYIIKVNICCAVLFINVK